MVRSAHDIDLHPRRRELALQLGRLLDILSQDEASARTFVLGKESRFFVQASPRQRRGCADFERYQPLSRLLASCAGFDRQIVPYHRKLYFLFLGHLRRDISWTISRYQQAMAESGSWDFDKITRVSLRSRLYLGKMYALGILHAAGLPVASPAIVDALGKIQALVRPMVSDLPALPS